jgi:predicted LPLAT superfamily acyltransferase
VKIRCILSSLLRIHSPHCEHCSPREIHGREMRNRLDELSGRMQPHSLDHADHGEALAVLDSKPGEILVLGSSSAGARQFLGEADAPGAKRASA